MPEKKVEELLSAYLDGELTQADQQRVRIRLKDSREARQQYDELVKLREVTESMSFAAPPEGRMEELERRLSVQTPRRLGWVFFLLGSIALAAMALIAFATSPDIAPWKKLAISGVGLGFALLLASVARQRWLELPHDRYRGVKK